MHLRTLALLLLGLAASAGPRAHVEGAHPAATSALDVAREAPLPFLAAPGAALVAPAERSDGPTPRHVLRDRLPPAAADMARTVAAMLPSAQGAPIIWSWSAVREHLLGTPPPALHG